jgi:proline iminopeptidase
MKHMRKQQDGYIPTESGLRLFYRRVGEGPDVIVVPSGSWVDADFEPLFSPARTLLFFDTRGRGASDTVVDPSQIPPDYELADLETIRQFFHIDQMALLGWSMNATTCARYAAAHPEFVARLVMMCPGYLRSEAPYHDMGRIQQIANARIDPAGLQHLEDLKLDGFDSAQPEAYCKEHQRVYLVRQMGMPHALDNMRSNPCAFENEWPRNLIAFIQKHPPPGVYDWRSVAASVQAPTRVIHGSEDLIPSESSAEWANTIPGAKLEIIEGSGHYPHLERPDAFFRVVDRVLAE